MFYNCKAIKELNLSNFSTSKVIDMSYMFYNCQAIKELNLSNFNTANVINMTNMFAGCRKLYILNNFSFDIKNNTRIKNMFSRCNYSLKEMERISFKNLNDNAFEDECENGYDDLYNFDEQSDFEFLFPSLFFGIPSEEERDLEAHKKKPALFKVDKINKKK